MKKAELELDTTTVQVGRDFDPAQGAGGDLELWYFFQRSQAEQERALPRDVIARSIASGNVGEVSAETIKAEDWALRAAR